MSFSAQELETCLKVLQQISDDPSVMVNHERFKGLVAKIHRAGKKQQRQIARETARQNDRVLLSITQIVQQQLQNTAALPAAQNGDTRLNKPINCYICKDNFIDVHHFYHRLCPPCAEFNFAKRAQSADLSGRVALISGARIKIGYQLALRMLRDGAQVLATTRFAADAERRFAAENDYAQWKHRLQIFALDLRDLPRVEQFADHLLETLPALDIIVNNAAQTVKRPNEWYRHWQNSASALPVGADNVLAVDETELNRYFPAQFDYEGLPLDLRPQNSWRLRLGEIDTVEMLEVQLVNAIAPFVWNNRLKQLLEKSTFERRFIINVSAMEGQFNRAGKTVFHPHTNMAKAALNMMTRTSGADYARSGIWMNSVDTGWISDENPHPIKTNSREQRHFFTPLDVIDGVARLYDPIVQGIEQPDAPLWGHFLKDYAPYDW